MPMAAAIRKDTRKALPAPVLPVAYVMSDPSACGEIAANPLPVFEIFDSGWLRPALIIMEVPPRIT
jgi:hypothetical protein